MLQTEKICYFSTFYNNTNIYIYSVVCMAGVSDIVKQSSDALEKSLCNCTIQSYR